MDSGDDWKRRVWLLGYLASFEAANGPDPLGLELRDFLLSVPESIADYWLQHTLATIPAALRWQVENQQSLVESGLVMAADGRTQMANAVAFALFDFFGAVDLSLLGHARGLSPSTVISRAQQYLDAERTDGV